MQAPSGVSRQIYQPCLSDMPIDMKNYITNIAVGRIIYTPEKIMTRARQIRSIQLLGKSFKNLWAEESVNLKRIYELVSKYVAYNPPYSLDYSQAPPLLLDAILSGASLEYGNKTFVQYTPEVEKDITDIVKLIPDSLNCTLGRTGPRSKVRPLFMAIINFAIPMNIFQFLLDHGADPKATIVTKGELMTIEQDCNKNLYGDRFTEIQDLFKKYSPAATDTSLAP